MSYRNEIINDQPGNELVHVYQVGPLGQNGELVKEIKGLDAHWIIEDFLADTEERDLTERLFYCRAGGHLWRYSYDGHRIFAGWLEDATIPQVEASRESACGCVDGHPKVIWVMQPPAHLHKQTARVWPHQGGFVLTDLANDLLSMHVFPDRESIQDEITRRGFAQVIWLWRV